MKRSCIDPEGSDIHKRVFDTFGMDKEERLTAVSHQHSFANVHRGTGVDTDPVSQPKRFHLFNLSREEFELGGLSFEGTGDLLDRFWIGIVDENSVYPFLENAKGGFSFPKVINLHEEVIRPAQ